METGSTMNTSDRCIISNNNCFSLCFCEKCMATKKHKPVNSTCYCLECAKDTINYKKYLEMLEKLAK